MKNNRKREFEIMYYLHTDVKKAIMTFASSEKGVKEVAIYNPKVRSVQRYFKESGEKVPLIIDERRYNEVAPEASAFYCSYWHYDGVDFSNPIGRDLVWVVRAKKGGISIAKFVTKMVCEALGEIGLTPLVKYSGELGFDIIIPFDVIPLQISAGGLEALDELHHQLTDQITSYIREKLPEAEMQMLKDTLMLRVGSDSCLLSELRVKRGLLLAPMSLNPKTGLVSVPVDPKKIDSFRPLDATPDSARGVEWKVEMSVAAALLRFSAVAPSAAVSS
ncbi:MAG: hypothetical protein ACK4GQ_01405 [Candidatus Hadarchaeales archaeon]